MIFSLLLSPAATFTGVTDNGGFIEARVKMQVEGFFPLAQVNEEAVHIIVDLPFNLQGHPWFHVQVFDLKFLLEQQNTFVREPHREP